MELVLNFLAAILFAVLTIIAIPITAMQQIFPSPFGELIGVALVWLIFFAKRR
jgi:TRAP-type C4-dicarboxylate transport system permease small subunit